MKKKFLFLMLITIFMLMLTACGGSLETTVNLNTDLSGTRTMKYVITKSDFAEYVTGDITSVDATIAANVPEGMTYVLTEDENNYIATFTMNFASPEDEATQVTTLINDGYEYNVDFIVGDSVFCTGFAYEEDFRAENVMGWFETLMINSGYVSSGNQSYIIDSSSSYVVYGGETVEGGSYVSASTMTYIPIEEVRIFTDVNADGTYNRTIELDILDANLLENETEIKDFMAGSVPTGATSEWVAELGLNTHRVVLENVTADAMQTAMNTYAHGSNSVFRVTEPTEEDYMEEVLLAENACFEEHLDMSAYGCNSYGTVEVSYFIQGEKVDGTFKVATEETDGELNYNTYGYYEDELYPEYEKYNLYDIREADIDYVGQYFYHFGSGTWNTTVKGENKITREITLLFDDGTTVEQGVALAERINTYLGESEEKIAAEVKAVETEEGFNGIEIVLKGSALEIADAMTYLTGMERSNGIGYVEESKWLGFRKACIFEETVNFDGILYTTYSDEYWQIPVEYTLDMPGSNPNKDLYDETEYDAKKGLILDTVSTSDSVTESAVTYKFSIMGLVWILVLLLSIASFLVGVVVIVIGFIKKSKAKKAGTVAAAPKAEAAPVVEEAPAAVEGPASGEAPVEKPMPVIEETSASEEAAIEEAKTE